MKTFGILMIALIPFFLSIRMGEAIRLKEKRQRAFLELLSHVHFQIENFNRDQGEIFARFENAVLRETEFFCELNRRVKAAPLGAFGAVWEAYGSEFSFDPPINEVLSRLAKHFGMLERIAQLEELEHSIEILEKNSEKGKTECENQIKILRTTGLTAGLGILILLL